AYHENNFTFEYALLSYFREADTRFRTQLVGFDREPSEWVADYKSVYTNLGKGDYTFRVWSRDYAGNITGPLEYKFKVRAAPWLTGWAYLCYIITILGASDSA